MHPRNRYQGPHDFRKLAAVIPELEEYFLQTPDGRLSLDFGHPRAVRLLNAALLKRDYGLQHWDIPVGSLCPGVPGRLDYLHLLAELLEGEGPQVQSSGNRPGITGLDLGVGASCIYPILGLREYGWKFVGSEVDEQSIKVARAIIKFNPGLAKSITLRRQPDRNKIFENIIRAGDFFDFSMCNPPFYENAESALAAARRKWKKLGKPDNPTFNFGGQATELWTPGGEPAFLRQMIRESTAYAPQVRWFTTLVSQAGYLKIAQGELDRAKARDVRILPMEQGGKKRRVLAWKM